MKPRSFLSILASILVISAVGQKPSLELTFTAIDSNVNVQIDSIKVINRTRGGDTVLYWPDTVLILEYQVGITELINEGNKFKLYQNYPNPAKSQTTISLYVPEKNQVYMMITDMLGRQVISTVRLLDKGFHSFRFTPGEGDLFSFTAYWRGTSSSIKILNAGLNLQKAASFEYIGSENPGPQSKKISSVQGFSFKLGDELLYIAYTNTLQSGMLDSPATSKIYTFQFATNMPCPGTPTVTYEGQVYNTIQIFSQCWLKENLNVGTMIPGSQQMSNDSIIEKYCYNNEIDSCTKYGGLYLWNEMMQYTTQQGTQGICPPDWHIPTDEEWKVLEGAVDSLYRIGNPQWDIDADYRGFNVGTNLKTTSGWPWGGSGTDLFGFSCLPGGYCAGGFFGEILGSGYQWTSTEIAGGEYYRLLLYNDQKVGRGGWYEGYGRSIRCIRDY